MSKSKTKTKPRSARPVPASDQHLIRTLLDRHGFILADTLPIKHRVSFTMTRRPGESKATTDAAPAIKLIVPSKSWLGKEILASRKERDPSQNKSRKARDKSREKSKGA